MFLITLRTQLLALYDLAPVAPPAVAVLTPGPVHVLHHPAHNLGPLLLLALQRPAPATGLICRRVQFFSATRAFSVCLSLRVQFFALSAPLFPVAFILAPFVLPCVRLLLTVPAQHEPVQRMPVLGLAIPAQVTCFQQRVVVALVPSPVISVLVHLPPSR